MEKQTQPIKDWYTEYKENQLTRDIKRCNAFATVSGVVASLSALVIAGNVVLGNGLEVLQVGGSTAAMFGYVLSYSQMGSIYKKEQQDLQESQNNEKSQNKKRLEELKYKLEILKTQLNMDYLVAGSFYATTLGNVIELLSIPEAPQIVSSITGAALSALVATLHLIVSKSHKLNIKAKETEIEGLEEIDKLEEESKKAIPELIEGHDILQLEAPIEEPEQPKILQLEEIPKKK